MSKIVVIYHRADFDGIFCREIARKFLGDTAEYIGWDYGDPTPLKAELNGRETLYMLDISVPDLMDHRGLLWIDHHKSAMEKYGPKVGYQVDGVAACRLAWQWFLCCDGNWAAPRSSAMAPAGVLPQKQDFINRNVTEPYAVQLAGEYDIWDKRNPDAELFQHGLRSKDLTSDDWNMLLSNEVEASLQGTGQDYTNSQLAVSHLLAAGRVIQYAKTEENKSIIEAFGFTVEFEGLTFLACNHARFNSHLFSAGLRPEHDGCLGFNWTGKDWRVSLYGVPGKPDVDLAAIAVKYGGGGHKQACGFRADWLPIWAKD